MPELRDSRFRRRPPCKTHRPGGCLDGDLVQDVREFLNGRDDDLLAFVDEATQVAGAGRVAHRRAHLHELPDGFLDLVIEDAPVGDDDDEVENLRPLALHGD